MSPEELKAKLHHLVEPVIEEHGLELVRLDFSSGRKAHLGIFIDKADGVTIADCETVSRALSDLLDAYDPIPQSYILEVSSPGVERPLSGKSDFQRYRGKMAKVYTREPVSGKKSFQGKIGPTGESDVEMTLAKGERIRIPLDKISKAHLWFRP
jgi:ribosome maturation factor RimP